MPTLPVVVFQLFTLKVYDAFKHSVTKVHPSLAAQLPHNKEALLTTITVGKFIRLLRDFFAKMPPDAEKMLIELQHSPRYTFFLLNGDMEFNRNRQLFV